MRAVPPIQGGETPRTALAACARALLLGSCASLCGLMAINASAQILQTFPFDPSLTETHGVPAPQPLFEQGDASSRRQTSPTPAVAPIINASSTTAGAVDLLGDRGSLLFPEMMAPLETEDLSSVRQAALAPSAVSGLLDARKRAMAQAAWAYVENNTDATTGLVRGRSDRTEITLWDIASSLAAIQSARQLELISKRTYDERVQAILRSLLLLETVEGLGIPHRALDSATGASLSSGSMLVSASSVDMGRLLTWLDIIRRRSPYFAPGIEKIVSAWRFCDLLNSDGQLQFLAVEGDGTKLQQPVNWDGYEHYAAKGFALWGFDANASLQSERFETVDLPGGTLPFDPSRRDLRALVDFEASALEGLEFGWNRPEEVTHTRDSYSDGWRAEIAHRLFSIQEQRWKRTGQLTARAPHYSQFDDTYVYDSIAVGSRPWIATDIKGRPQTSQSAVSTRAAFASWALWQHPYAELLFDAVADRYDDQLGYPEGLLESGLGPIEVYSLGTNAGVLQALAYALTGPLHPGAIDTGASAFRSSQAIPPAQRAQNCLPLAPAEIINTPLPMAGALERCEDLGGGAVGNCTL